MTHFDFLEYIYYNIHMAVFTGDGMYPSQKSQNHLQMLN